ncbi:TlpA family protein disulfide reductase [Sphingobacterium paramultivorum]|uniref:TlpA family protein disulfide reductase n=1 Tax=Sphingobacterium paramultivorum TaxID=2886510 RepID=UPI00129CA6D9|nr:thioredoxin-like domain-containing protein [Sphingobacterium paramultivorum]
MRNVNIITFILLLFCAIKSNCVLGNAERKNTTITVELTDRQEIGELQLILFKDEYIGPVSFSKEAIDRYTARSKGNQFVFHLDLKGCQYFQLNLNQEDISDGLILAKNIVERGDDVHIKIGKNNLSFKGKGHQKMEFLAGSEKEFSELKDSVMKSVPSPDVYNKQIGYLLVNFKNWSVVKQIMVDKIEDRDLKFSANAQRYLKAEILGKIDYNLYNGANATLAHNRFSALEIDTIQQFLKDSDLYYGNYVNKDEYLISTSRIEADVQYYRFSYRLEKLHLNNNSLTLSDYLENISTKGASWEKMMCYYTLHTYDQMLDPQRQISAILAYMKDPKYITRLQGLIDNQYKQKDFELFDKQGNIVKLSSLSGKPVFLDFWFIGCSACADYFSRSVAKAETEFGKDVMFISICVEKDKNRWMKAIKSNQYTSSKVLNLYTGVRAWKHPVISEFAVLSAPRPFLLDSNAKIITVNPIDLGRSNYEKLRETLKKALNK